MDTLQALVRQEGPSQMVLAPSVGFWVSHLAKGQWAGEGTPIGRLQVLSQVMEVRLPQGTQGWIEEVCLPLGAVELGSPLVQISPSQEVPLGKGESTATDASSGPIETEGLLLLKAPMDGIFYRRPRPDRPPFVEEGQLLSPGDTIGLIEVMKTFYPFTCETSSTMKVVKFLVGDGSEVKQGQPVVQVSPPEKG